MRAILLASAVGIALCPLRAEAIPAFAREYRVPCQTCHVVISRRGEFGDVFRKAGFHWPTGDKDARKDPPVDLEGIALFSSFLPAKLPLALATTFGAAYALDPTVESKFTFGTPTINLLLGGAVGDHLGFFGTWSGQGPPNELYLHISRVFGRPEINFILGRFEQSTTLYKGNEAIVSRLLLSSGSLNGFSVSTGRLGLEYNGIFFNRTFIALGAVQDAGIGSRVDFYYHVSQKIGGMTFLGGEPNIDLEHPSIIEDFVVTVGHWGYRGVVEGPAGEETALIRRLGLDLQLRFHDLNLWSGVMYGFDGDLVALRPVKNITWFAELSYEFFSWLVAAYLYQYQDRSQLEREVQLHDFALLWLPFENLRVRARFGFSDDGVDNEVLDAQILFSF